MARQSTIDHFNSEIERMRDFYALLLDHKDELSKEISFYKRKKKGSSELDHLNRLHSTIHNAINNLDGCMDSINEYLEEYKSR